MTNLRQVIIQTKKEIRNRSPMHEIRDLVLTNYKIVENKRDDIIKKIISKLKKEIHNDPDARLYSLYVVIDNREGLAYVADSLNCPTNTNWSNKVRAASYLLHQGVNEVVVKLNKYEGTTVRLDDDRDPEEELHQMKSGHVDMSIVKPTARISVEVSEV